ncbi:MAG: ROK family protein [Spirochaetota bacterium]
MYAIGLDLGGTNLKGGIVSDNGDVYQFTITPSGVPEGPKKILENLIVLTGFFLKKADEMGISISGIGVATPGIIDPSYGGITGGADNLPGWRGTPFMRTLYEEFKLPVHAHNDVTAITLGELRHGAGRGKQNVILAAFGTGIGGGIVVDGKLYGGHTGYGGEIGHMVIRADGYRCSCGIRGCWEEYASIRGIMRTARNYISKDSLKESTIYIKINNKIENLTPKVLFDSAREGDRLALQIIDEVGNNAAIGIGNLINIFNPELFIVGGGIALAGEIFVESIKKHIHKWSLKDSREATEILLAELGEKAGVVGASTLVFENINRSNFEF